MEDKVIKNKIQKIGFLKFATILLVISGAFGLGLVTGNGKISLNQGNKALKSVQKDTTANLEYSSVEALYDKLRVQFDGQLDQSKLMDGIRSGLVKAAGDPYTEYFNPASAEQFNQELSGTFTGIGAELGKDEKNNIIVVSPIAGFPAEKAGLKPKDIIAEIDGKSAYDISITEAVQKIRGKKDTTVVLKIVRGVSQVLEISIVRQEITIPSVTSKILEGNIGYIRISRFSDDTVRLSNKAASDFKASGVVGIVLDMRSDPGGLVDSAVGVAGLWLPTGKNILTERRGNTIVQTYNSDGPGSLAGIKTVVLIDEGSASASEIVAGALKDNGAASLFGVKSFGKGSVQQLEKLSDGSLLKVTIARWYTPSGKNIDKEGISPDTVVKRSDEDFKKNIDPQLEAALKYLKK